MNSDQPRQHGVLFDLDGVILDTEGIYSEFWSRIDQELPTHVPHFADVIKGSNLQHILNTYFPANKHSEIVARLNQFQHDMPYRFFPHALEWLRTLQRAGMPMCLVTSSDQRKMDAVYSQHPRFRDFFASVVVGEMVSRPKPYPDCFLLGAKRLGIDINHCYVFEDSLNGLAAGRASGAKVIALATTNSREALQGKADLIIDSFEGFTIEKMLAL